MITAIDYHCHQWSTPLQQSHYPSNLTYFLHYRKSHRAEQTTPHFSSPAFMIPLLLSHGPSITSSSGVRPFSSYVWTHPVPVFSCKMIMSPLRWELEDQIHQTHALEPLPAETLPVRLYIPTTLQPKVLQSVYYSALSGQGLNGHYYLFKGPFGLLWPKMSSMSSRGTAASPSAAAPLVTHHAGFYHGFPGSLSY